MDPNEIDIIHSELFWNSHNYEEYLVQCNLENIEPFFNEEAFNALKHGSISFDISFALSI